ncbi:hypothetical protein EDD91_0261 [Streptomyces sp. KS 21]|nr:hypothetical protein EDD91_0261 [Streptomyces sp. KS 21]
MEDSAWLAGTADLTRAAPVKGEYPAHHVVRNHETSTRPGWKVECVGRRWSR